MTKKLELPSLKFPFRPHLSSEEMRSNIESLVEDRESQEARDFGACHQGQA